MADNNIQTRLIESAQAIIKARYKENYHHVGAALITKSGREFAAVHLEANVGRIAVCAEAVALGMAAAEGDTEIALIVAVIETGQVVSPCGMCRELISDYAPDALVIVPDAVGEELRPDAGGTGVVPISDLLPNKYR